MAGNQAIHLIITECKLVCYIVKNKAHDIVSKELPW